jgi:hypothetical protein
MPPNWNFPAMIGPEKPEADQTGPKGLMPSEMKRLRQFEEENGKVKKIVADLSLDNAMLQDVIRRKF